MVDPTFALLIFFLLVLLGAAVFWPGGGIVSRVSEFLGMTERVRLEDTLKHLYKCEYAGRSGSVESVAGTVGVSRGRALELLTQLEEMALVRTEEAGISLTDAGRDYALHIVRTHRLLERYLADRTGVRPADWHREAERREHSFSPSDTNTLAARLGYPRYDPHGDPIPTSKGDLPPLTGSPLTALRAGEVASIVHLGDEPHEVFDALTRAGLSPHMPVKVLEIEKGGVRFEAGGREHTLSPVLARSVTVERLKDAELSGDSGETLAELTPGASARVLGIHPSLQGPQRRRLLDLGLVPGTRVDAELASASGDPVAFRVRGALIALRKDQAKWILVDHRLDEEA